MLTKLMFFIGRDTLNPGKPRVQTVIILKTLLTDLGTELSDGGSSCRILPMRPEVPRSEGLHPL